MFQVTQRKGPRALPALSPEVLSVFVPPFASKEDGQVAGASCPALGKAKRRSFRKKKEKPPGRGLPDGSQGSEDVSVPNGVDLIALPQLCFPGSRPGAGGPRATAASASGGQQSATGVGPTPGPPHPPALGPP